ncbi:MAG TPA: hypothetical protein VMU34_14235 [Mycobacterium sp.]|nr:hypothetical protein [Mycobacterium sp.]
MEHLTALDAAFLEVEDNDPHVRPTPHVEISAVVSRGGRPDLAGAAPGAVRAPTLLIVG